MLYVLTGTVPGTLDAQTQRQIETGPQRHYCRRRFLTDLQANPPTLFVDAVGPGRVAYQDRSKQGFESFPGLQEHISSNYGLTDDLQNVRLFVRRGSPTALIGDPVTPPVAIHTGGEALPDPGEFVWRADAFFYGGAPLTFRSDNAPELPPLYSGEWVLPPSCEYRIPVPNESYHLKLHFIERSYPMRGPRVFDNVVNRAKVAADLDVLRESGGVNRPLIREFDVTVSDGQIVIGLLPKVREAEINGIEILPSAK
jgi:hypothetical protein